MVNNCQSFLDSSRKSKKYTLPINVYDANTILVAKKKEYHKKENYKPIFLINTIAEILNNNRSK